MIKKLAAATVAAAVLAGGAAHAASCDGMKLYQVSSGTLTLDKSGLTKGVDIGKMLTTAVAMYIWITPATSSCFPRRPTSPSAPSWSSPGGRRSGSRPHTS